MQSFKRNEVSKSHKQIRYQPRNNKSQTADQSTTILQSNKTVVNFTDKVNHNISKIPKCSFHQFCSHSHQNQLTFQPKINELPYEIYPKQWQNLTKSKKQKWQKLIQDNRQRNLQRIQKKIIQQQKDLKTYTFSPQITPFQQIQTNKQNIFDKLHDQAKTRRLQQQQRQLKQRQRQSIQLNKLQLHLKQLNTDKYNILNKQKFDLEPLYKRLQKVIQQKRRNKKMIAQRQHVLYPFKPEINNSSKELLANKNIIANVVDRLIDQYKNKQNKMGLLKQKYQYDLKKQLTFKPFINHYIPVNIQNHQLKQPIQMPTFTPSINPLSNLIMQDRQNQTHNEKIERLHKENIDKWHKLHLIQTQAYSQCVFNPEINQISKQLSNFCPKPHICQVKVQPTPTYRPKINEVSHFMTEAKRTKSLDTIKKKKRERAEQYKKQNEYDQLKECSFRPKIKDNKSQRKMINNCMNLQKVAGTKKYFQTVQKGLQRQRKRRQLQQKIFNLQKRYDMRMQRQLKLKNQVYTSEFLHNN